MALAFITGINEDLILNGQIDFDLQDRVQHGIEVLMNAPLKIELTPNFTIKTIENMIRRYHTKGVNYFFFDYLGTSLGIIEEITKRTRGMAMREDTVLFLFSTKLKELAVELDCFIFSATQLNQDWKTDSFPDQNLLRGAKSVADRLDNGSILLNVTEEDLKKLGPVLQENGLHVPNVKLSVYKNRRGALCQCFLWMIADKGTCRFVTEFVTDWWYNPIEVAPLKIETK